MPVPRTSVALSLAAAPLSQEVRPLSRSTARECRFRRCISITGTALGADEVGSTSDSARGRT